jgi:hypothetical protein
LYLETEKGRGPSKRDTANTEEVEMTSQSTDKESVEERYASGQQGIQCK